MNGDAEVFMRIIVYTAFSMLITANLRLDFWAQAVLCANYLLNRAPTKGSMHILQARSGRSWTPIVANA